MLDDIRTRLKRMGMLQPVIGGQGQQDLSRTSLSDEALFNQQPNNGISNIQNTRNNTANMNQSESMISSLAQPSQQIDMKRQKQEKTFMQRTIRNLLSSTEIQLEDTDINFYLYQEHGDHEPLPNFGEMQGSLNATKENVGKDIPLDYLNIRNFHYVLNTTDFLRKNLCFRLHFPDSTMKVKAISDEDLDLSIKGVQCLVLNPCFKHKQGLIEDFDFTLKLPMRRKMLKFVGNYDISVKIQKAVLDMNKKFIKKFIKWFVNLYTLQKIVKVAKSIILKTHYQDEILKNIELNGGQEVQFENYRDTMIPKRLKIQILEGIDMVVTDSCKTMWSFMEFRKTNPGGLGKDMQDILFSLAKFQKTTFELLRKMQNTYYIIVRTDKADLSINENFNALEVERFVQEIDFTFHKEVTDLPVKKSKLEVDSRIKIDKIESNLTSSMFSYILNTLNLYKAMAWTSSIKSTINGMLLDEDFLKANVLFIIQQRVGTEFEKRILSLYQQPRYQDSISASFQLNQLKLYFDKQDDYDPQCHLKGLFLKQTGMDFKWKNQHGRVHKVLNVEQMSLQPILKRNLKKEVIPPLALIASKNLRYEQTVYLGAKKKCMVQNVKAEKLQVDINYEAVLDMSNELIDFWFIHKHFSNKWNSKYQMVKEVIPCDQLKSELQIESLTLIWNLSTSRFISVKLTELSTTDNCLTMHSKNYVKFDDEIKFGISTKDIQVTHYKYVNEDIDEFYRCCFVPIENKMITGNGQGASNSKIFPKVEKIQEQIFTGESASMVYEQNKDNVSVNINLAKGELDLPDKYHFSAVIYEMQKQYFHCKRWFDAKIESLTEEMNFKFKKWKSSLYSDLELMAKQKMQAETDKIKAQRSFMLEVKVKDATFSIEENSLKKVFVDKSEVVEILSQRRYFRLKQKPFLKFWDKMQKENLNKKYVHMKGKNVQFKFELPKKFKNKEYLLNRIKSLDEGRQFITPETFSHFKPGIHSFKMDYFYMLGRNMFRPFIELWNLNWKQTFIVAHINPSKNPDLFTKVIKKKIFQRFDMNYQFVRLLSKWYYDCSIDIQKLRINTQGQTSLLFQNDFYQQLFSRFIYEDISRGRDPEQKFLKYLMSMDRSRARMHGQFKISVLSVQMSVYSKRNFNRFDQYFQILLNDFIYHSVYQKHQICFRDFIVKKEPLQQFEALFVKLPIVEIKYFVEYNEGRTVNHFFNQQSVKTMQDWDDRVKSFMRKSQSVEIKLNIPTLGTFNETQRKCLYLPTLLQSYAENSPIPMVHYQRSHMIFFDEFMREFQANRIDISSKVYNKIQQNSIGMNKRYTRNFIPQLLEKSRTKFQGFLNDIIFILSDFKEEIGFGMDIKGSGNSDAFDGMALEEQFISPEDIDDHSKKDEYLKRYNGIIFTNENLVVQSEFTYRPNHVIYFEINDSLASFNLFRISKMTSKNLFKIRHPCFNTYRNIQFEKSLNNYTRFCKFFDIDEHKPLENNEKAIRQKLPQFEIPPVEMIEEEMQITKHTFYSIAYGSSPQINYDPSLKYKQLLGNFKTIFPKYILTNEQIQKDIRRSNFQHQIGGGHVDHSANTTLNQSSSNRPFQRPQMISQQDLVDDFIFSENDTFGTLIQSEYRQDQKIKYKSME